MAGTFMHNTYKNLCIALLGCIYLDFDGESINKHHWETDCETSHSSRGFFYSDTFFSLFFFFYDKNMCFNSPVRLPTAVELFS